MMRQNRIRFVLCVVAACLPWLRGSELDDQSKACVENIAEDSKRSLLQSVRTMYGLPDTVVLSFIGEERLEGSCYHRLKMRGRGPVQDWDLVLYASPDLHFLFSDLFDATRRRDPDEAGRDADMAELASGALAVRGSEHSAVVIVEFSDFQCPFCRQLAQALDEVLRDGSGSDVRLVFRHFPVTGHSWARAAAIAAACAAMQSPQAFWSMHDQIFENQRSITADNLDVRLSAFAAGARDIDVSAFEKCRNTGASLGRVLKDMNLAEAHDVGATPSLFINGDLVRGAITAVRLRELIDAARDKAVSMRTQHHGPVGDGLRSVPDIR